MVFSTLFFVFLFFVLSYAAQAVFPDNRRKNIVLLASSLIFYAWGGPLLVLLLLFMTFVCWGGALLIGGTGDRSRRRLYMTLTAVIVLGLIGFFKYTGFLVSTFNGLFGAAVPVPDITLPIGISFYTFQLLSYVIDVYRGDVGPQKRFMLLLLYASLFHQCIAGPIVRYRDVELEIEGRRPLEAEISRGITRFSVGLCKKALLANAMAVVADSLLPCAVSAEYGTAAELAARLSGTSAVAVLFGGLAYMFQIYLDFSAYSDMAIGMGLMIGFHYKENFNYPYTALSVTDFWRRWHISLSSFFRDYVYIPLGGNRCPVPRQILNLFVVWFLTGLWHGASWNYILWGLYFFVFLVLEKFVFRWSAEPRTAAGSVLRGIYTLTVVYFSWMLFRFEDFSLLTTALRSLFCLNGNPFSDAVGLLTVKNNIFIIILAGLATLPVVPAVNSLLDRVPDVRAARAARAVLSVSAPVVCLGVSLLMLIGDSYNPFLYFQF
jgi:alginate O-acetyltransferase complex protein AlgI